MKIVDATGLSCPIPLLFLRRALISVQSGECVCLISTDEKSVNDVPKFCEQMNHVLISVEQDDAVWKFTVKKG